MGLALALLALGVVAACGPKAMQFDGVDITGADYAQDFRLTDTNGKTRSLADFRGKVVVLFFGYTQCPDVCPTTMSELKSVKQMLGPDGSKLQVLFVTLDPQRDTAALLAQYVPSFDPTFIGLSGDERTTEETAKAFKIFYRKVDGPTPTSYTLDHTAGMYVFDPEGHIRLFLRQAQPAASIAHDVRLLIAAR